MSKMIKQSLLILIVLLVLSVGVAVMTLIQKQGLEKQKVYLEGQVTEYESKDRERTKRLGELEKEAKQLKQDFEQASKDKAALQKKNDDAEQATKKLSGEISDLREEKAEWDRKLANLRRERDELTEKLKNRPVEEKIVEKVVEVVKPGPLPQPGQQFPQGQQPRPAPTQTTIVVENNADEAYWAGVLKQKTALELELADLKKKLSDASVQVEEMKRANADLEVEVGRMRNEREDIVRKIKYGEELADSLSIEVARARNEQKATQDRADKVLAENQNLYAEIKQLNATKVALEKSMARIMDDKNTIERKLVETESIIQSRIDDIWKIKKDVDTRFDVRKGSASGEIELAPIVVNANAPATQLDPAAMRKDGAVVSINDANNFVIIDMGEKDGVRVGDGFRVYRDGKQIGMVSVIQVRKDISAADIKQKTAAFRAGDLVK